ncbi:MAG: hypothetical protein H6719_16780 [Sandaracinaceae bacterium]|nr:hypothetical protein [Sandaracinaceae bacterium]
MKLHGTLAAIVALAASAGCSTGIQLTDEGGRVQHITRADMPSGCNLLGDVAIGIPPDAARPRTEDELVTLMRNKAGQIGGTHLLVDNREQREDSSGNPYYRGRGVAYACPHTEAAVSAEGGGGGGDDTSGGEDTGGGDSGGDSGGSDDDDMMDDLLGE